jgi:hypothetical protein
MNEAELQAALANCAREILLLLQTGRSFFAAPSDDEIMDLAVKYGLAKRERFDPDKHGAVPDADEGDEVYAWTFPL